MNISTIVTITEGESIKQNAIDQTIGIKGLNKGNLIYKVETNATTTDSETNSHSTAENAYIYWNNTYFYNYPGVKYQSPIEKDAAERNIRNLMNIISFDKEEMVDLSKEYEDEHAIFTFSVGYESVSDYVKSLLQSAANNFESVNFKPVDATAIAKVNKAEIIIERELYVEYKGENGERIVLEIYTELTSTPEIEVPNSKEYAK
ncbi:MAG: hypothetical protein IJ297_01345 [Clostridia bacterium]|nr:hypothetical protein [Clostridia bacterium]